MSTGQHGPMGQPELRGPSTPPPPASVGDVHHAFVRFDGAKRVVLMFSQADLDRAVSAATSAQAATIAELRTQLEAVKEGSLAWAGRAATLQATIARVEALRDEWTRKNPKETLIFIRELQLALRGDKTP